MSFKENLVEPLKQIIADLETNKIVKRNKNSGTVFFLNLFLDIF